MNILVVGSGGREHALVRKLAESPSAGKIYCAPGNAGIAADAECVNIAVDDLEGLADFAENAGIGLTVVGPEIPMTMGIADEFEKRGLKVFGPSGAAAEIEGSKVFSKELMHKYGVPTGGYGVFEKTADAMDFVSKIGLPCVVKADGLAAGKGVIICATRDEAESAVKDMLENSRFGEAGNRIIIEEFLTGQEVSMLAFTDGKTIVPMISAQDHKRVFDDDLGPNTGGMGAYTPAPVYTDEIHGQVMRDVLEKTVAAMEKEGRKYKGVLYAGLILTPKGVRTLEFNARFGDPETQAVLPRLKSDLVEICLAVAEERLSPEMVEWHEGASACVVIASGGYPGDYEKGKVISGLDEAEAAGAEVYHAGTCFSEDGERILTSGGRVLGVTALGEDIRSAVDNAYGAVGRIFFDGMHYRKDIARKAFDD